MSHPRAEGREEGCWEGDLPWLSTVPAGPRRAAAEAHLARRGGGRRNTQVFGEVAYIQKATGENLSFSQIHQKEYTLEAKGKLNLGGPSAQHLLWALGHSEDQRDTASGGLEELIPKNNPV